MTDNTYTIPKISQQDAIVTFNFDGTIVINPKYTVDEAAKAFWESVKDMAERDGRRVSFGNG